MVRMRRATKLKAPLFAWLAAVALASCILGRSGTGEEKPGTTGPSGSGGSLTVAGTGVVGSGGTATVTASAASNQSSAASSTAMASSSSLTAASSSSGMICNPTCTSCGGGCCTQQCATIPCT